MPSPGRITRLEEPHGFGVRFDSGYHAGDEVSQYYDNLIAKLIVWGKDRPTAIARMLSALAETKIEGVATTIPADVAILRHPDFVDVAHSTKWVEERLDLSGVAATTATPPDIDDGNGARVQRSTTVEVNGKRFDVTLWVPDADTGFTSGPARKAVRKPRRLTGPGQAAGGGAGSGSVTVPMQGTIVKVLVDVGQQVQAGQAIVVLEAMKMENQISAEREGTVKEIRVAAGDTVGGGDVVAVIE
jgi:acetyl-CoA/propionyl-CoA carboxylase biotin carboxyl carrier protein